MFGRKDESLRSCRRTAEYRNRNQSAQPRPGNPPVWPHTLPVACRLKGLGGWAFARLSVLTSKPPTAKRPNAPKLPNYFLVVSPLTEQLRAAVARYERDDNLGALFDVIRAMARDAGTDALIAAAEEYHDRPEVVIPVYEHVTSERPDDARALVVLANAYWLTGRGPDVVGDLAERAKAADPQNRGAWHLWALAQSDVRARVQRWQRVTDQFPDDLLARAALADNAASLAGAEHDPLALDLAVRTYEGLWRESPTPTQRRALEQTLETLRGWKL